MGNNYNWRAAYQPVTLQQTSWNNTQALPIRFGNMTVQEQNNGGLRNYAVTFNGQPVLYANNQPGQLRFNRSVTSAAKTQWCSPCMTPTARVTAKAS